MTAITSLPVDLLAQIGRATQDQPSYGALAQCCRSTARIGRDAHALQAKKHFKALPFPLEELPRTLLVQAKFRPGNETIAYEGVTYEQGDMSAMGIEVITVYCLRNKRFLNGEEDYNINDYVSCDAPSRIVPEGFTGMIWSYSRENNGYCIFDPYVMPNKITYDQARAKYPGLDEALAEYTATSRRKLARRYSQKGYYEGAPEEFRYWEVSLARVDRIIDHNMYDYDAERQLTRAETSKAVNLAHEFWQLDHDYWRYEDDTRPTEDVLQGMMADITQKLKQLGVVQADGSVKREDGTHRDGPENWNFSCEVNSPWVFGPQKPFPDGFDDSHDGFGCYVKCQCTSKTGKQFEYTFWGDKCQCTSKTGKQFESTFWGD